ncbi:MAG TPA: molybdopterin-dependent oxidoreductase [Steroidobacteraceae bacterium]|nr:molybdopterin-dependent oxidoreductase [Steroidobacteraceae bacterium]
MYAPRDIHSGPAGIRTTCPYCGVGCGVRVRSAGAAIQVAGDPHHPANFGRLCSKGTALADTVGLEGRLLHPQIGGQRVSWDAAVDHVALNLQRIIQEDGPDAVALYVSGQLLTEDYYVANKLMKGYVGSANIDTNSRLCMASAVAGHKRAFGGDLVPGCYEDLDLAELIVLVGSNTAWCHPVIFQRIMQARQQRPELKLVVIDPRRTPTCEVADLHLPITSGTDVRLFNGLLSYLHQHGAADAAFIDEHTSGLEAALAAACSCAAEVSETAKLCGIDAARLTEFYRLFAATERVVTAFSQGVNQSSAGTDKVNSIINCHLLCGRIGRPGMGPFSLTGQPNAMGGREVGGMANMLAAHLEIGNPEHRRLVQEFWKSPRMAATPGLKAVELFEAMHAGRIKAVWIMATNPLVSLPDADFAREALQRCELVVVSDCVATDTTAFADVLLPAAAWGEKDGTVTNSERRISRQRAFLPLPGEAMPDWWIVSEVAARMGYGRDFHYSAAHEIFDEHARLSGLENGGSRAFDISGLAGLGRAGYDELEPVQWPLRHRSKGGTQRLFEDGRFLHADGRARFIPTPVRAPAHSTDEGFPFVLNTGRIRDQWHTMTRTGRSATLAEHLPEPFVDLHAQDALLAGVRSGELARVRTRWGSMVARVRTSGEIKRGTIFVPIHWNSLHASQARVGALVSSAVDPVSGEPEFKHTPAQVEPFVVDWHGFLMTRVALPEPEFSWWTAIRGEQFLRYEFAGRQMRSDPAVWARTLLGATDSDADFLDYRDETAGIYRAAHIVDERLIGCVFLSVRPDLPARSWLGALFGLDKLDDTARAALLAGRPRGARSDPGPIVCSCFRVGSHTLREAIEKHGITSTQQIGAQLRAGTNCGSCLPEIRKLIAATSAA